MHAQGVRWRTGADRARPGVRIWVWSYRPAVEPTGGAAGWDGPAPSNLSRPNQLVVRVLFADRRAGQAGGGGILGQPRSVRIADHVTSTARASASVAGVVADGAIGLRL